MIPENTTVLIAGGGPAGSTAGAILARQGIDVVVLERDTFPRYHIGESLLPSLIPILDISGARDAVEQHGFVKKPGAYLEWGPEKWSLRFGELSGIAVNSFQVIRSEFDEILLRNAARQGAQVYENVTIADVTFDDDRPVSASYIRRDNGKTGKITFNHLIDCTGRNGVIANQHLNARRYHNVFKNVALWSYWNGAAIEGYGEPGSIRVFSIDAGWLWFIPLHDGTMSVGAVIHQEQFNAERQGGTFAAAYERVLARHPVASEILKGATHGTVKLERDYSYTSDRFSGPGYFIAGDAACFLDPLLSSGVHLAMFSSLIASASINSVLRGEVSEEKAASFFEKSYRQAYLRFLVFVSAFYDQNRGQKGYFWEAQQLTSKDYDVKDLKKAFISLVSGSEDYDDMQDPSQSKSILGKISSRLRDNLEIRNGRAPIDPGDPKIKENQQFFDAVEGLFTLTKAGAIDGLYVGTEPHVRLLEVA